MFKALFNMLIGMLGTIVQIVVWPINQVIETALPDLTDKIYQVTDFFSTVFDCISWGLGLLPHAVVIVLAFVLMCEIAKHTIFVSTHSLIKIWNIIQKLKFW